MTGLYIVLFTIGTIVACGCAYLFQTNPPLATVGMILGVVTMWRSYHGL
jgi:hypothetical protein